MKLGTGRLLCAIATVLTVSSASAQPITGVYRGEIYNVPNLINAYAAWLGHDVPMGQGHQPKDSWANIENPSWQLNAWGAWVKAKAGRRLNYSVAMFPSGQGSLATCATGAYDFRFRNLANNMANAGLQRSIIRVGWEFSGSWMPWYSGNGQQANFAECFRRIVTAMRTAQPNAGFEFDWNPNYDISSADLLATYPGNAYVDYIGFDLYDQGWNGRYPIPAGCTGACRQERWEQNWNIQFAPALTKFRDFAQPRGKRLSVPEWGVNDAATTGGGDNTYFVQQMLSFIFNPANNVGYHSYFDYQAPDGLHQLSNVDNNGGHTFQTQFPNSAALFKNFYANLPTGGGSGQLTTTKATVTPSAVTRGQSFQVSGAVTSPTAQTLVVKYEIRGAASPYTLVAERFYSQAFTAGQTHTFTPALVIPTSRPAGTYRVDTLVYTSNWSQTLLYRNDTTFTAN
ncbi:glycoside hydrolase family 26 protein [Myxococcus sp. 1LA]